VSGGSGYDNFFLGFYASYGGVWGADGVVITDFQPGIDDLYFSINGEDASLSHSGDIYTMHWVDRDAGDSEMSFQILGITNLSSSDYEWT